MSPDSFGEAFNKNMELLETLTANLPAFPPRHGEAGQWQEYEMTSGRSKARNLLTIPGKISAADWWNSAGCEFQTHGHVEREFLLVYEGEMLLNVEGKEYMLRAGDSKYIAPGLKHGAYFPVSTYYLAVTVPDNPEWPE